MNDDTSNEDDLLRRYLLGELTDEEVDRLERRLLEDDDLFETMEAVEGDLLAACARGDLKPGERERVLRRLASSPRGRDRFALIQGLTRIAAEQPVPVAEPEPVIVPFPSPVSRRPSILRWLPLAAGLVVAIGGGALLVREAIHPPTGGGQIAQNEPAATPWPQETPPPTPAPPVSTTPPVENDPAPPASVTPARTPTPTPVPPPITATLQLALSSLRGAAEIPQLEIPQEAERVELQVDLGGDEHASYNVSLMNLTTGDGTWEKSGVPPRTLGGRTALLLDVPAGSFPEDGDYQLTVEGLTSDGQIEFAGAPEFEIVRSVS